MAAVKRKPPNAQLEGDDAPALSPEELQREREAALLAELHTMRAKFAAYIEEKAQAQKLSRDGVGLPIDFLRAQLQRGECQCRTIARFCGDPDA